MGIGNSFLAISHRVGCPPTTAAAEAPSEATRQGREFFPVEKLPPHAPESTILGTAGQAGSSPAPGKCCCGCALTHSTNSNHSAPLAFLSGKAKGDSGIESTGTKRATNLEHKTRNGDFFGAIGRHCPKAAAGCGALLFTIPSAGATAGFWQLH